MEPFLAFQENGKKVFTLLRPGAYTITYRPKTIYKKRLVSRINPSLLLKIFL
jgi:hypothetical protein